MNSRRTDHIIRERASHAVTSQTPISATHPGSHIDPSLGFRLSRPLANMRLGVRGPPHGVGWGVRPSSSDVPSCNAVSGILPIPLRFTARHPFRPPLPEALHSTMYRPVDGPPTLTTLANMRLRVGGLPHGVGWGRGGVRVMCPRVTQFQTKK